MTILPTELPSWFLRTKAGQEAVAEAEKAKAAQRKTAAATIAELHRRHEAALPPLQAAAADARQRELDAHQAWEDARRARAAAEHAVTACNHAMEQAVAEQTTVLHVTRPAAVDAFVAELLALYDALRTHGGRLFTKINLGGRGFWETSSPPAYDPTARTADDVRAAMVTVFDAIADARALRARYVDDVEAEIAAIRRTIPPWAINEIQAVARDL